MEVMQDKEAAGEYLAVLRDFLNENGLDGHSILAISRHADAVSCAPGEVIFHQGQQEPHVFFLVHGDVGIHAHVEGQDRELGQLSAVCVLGEISYFNNTKATANVTVKGDHPAVMFRLPYGPLGEIIEANPKVRDALSRIGDLRLITQNHGFAPYGFFMDMIGWKRNRFTYDHEVLPLLEDAVKKVLLPRLAEAKSILEVGDGPGVVSELLCEYDPDLMDKIYIQATDLESAVLNPFTALPSDLRRGRELKRTFDVLIAMQVFNTVPANQLTGQMEIAHHLIKPGGYLFIVRSRMLNIQYPPGSSETDFFFELLQDQIDVLWPGARGGEPLIETTFVDADIDAIMTWNDSLCDQAIDGNLKIPHTLSLTNREMLERFLLQATKREFSPDSLYFHWLVAKALEVGFTLESHEHHTDLGFFYQLLYRF